MIYDTIIIGAGTAGMSAGLYAKRSGLEVLILENNIPGGQIVSTPDVENYPGIKKTTGVDFASGLMEQITDLGVNISYESVLTYDLTSKTKEITTKNNVYQCKTVIIANGVNRRELGCKGEDSFKGKGVSYCATCDGAFFKGKVTAIVGGGNTALEDALFLSNNCKKVYLIHRREEFRGNQILVDSILKRENIEILYNSKITQINGELSVSSIVINTDGQEKTHDVSGVFVAIGLIPNNQPFEGVIELDKTGYIKADETLKTNISGVFVAGDTRTKLVRQLVTAASDGAVSAIMCANYLNEN